MRTILLFLILTACGHAQTIKDNSIVNRMLNLSTYSASDIKNLQIYTSVSGNALTIGIYGADTGSAPTTLKPVEIIFRNSSNGTGNYVRRLVTAATTLVVPSGTTLGTSNGIAESLWVYAIDNDGTVELGVSNYSILDTSVVVSSTAISGGATKGVLYSNTARSSKAVRLIGKIISTQTTAGTWATNPSTYQIGDFSTFVQPTVTRYTSSSGTYTTPKNVKYLKVTVVGGGAGGFGSGTAAGTAPTAGGNSTFGSSLITGSGGAIGSFASGSGGSGGGVTISSPAVRIAEALGSDGGPQSGNGTQLWHGGNGGSTCLAGAAAGGVGSGTGANGGVNTGGGGGGGGISGVSGGYSGPGGAGGGCAIALINNPDSTYSFGVGAGGAGGGAGTSGRAGGAGGSGVIIIEEYYNSYGAYGRG